MHSPPCKTELWLLVWSCRLRINLTYVHVVEACVDTAQSLGVGNEFVDLEGTVHVVYKLECISRQPRASPV